MENLTIYNSLERRVKASARNDRRRWMNTLADQTQDAVVKHQTREVYRLSKQLTGKSGIPDRPVKTLDGKALTN